MLPNKEKSLDVKRVGTSLVAAFHRADPPLIWTFDLERNHSFTVALQGEDGDWDLGVTSPKGEFYAIARFLVREDADEALAHVEKVLMKGKGVSALYGIKVALGLVVLACFLALVSSFGYSHFVHAPQSSAVSVRTQVAAPASKEQLEGVPLSADDVLTPPR